MPTTPSAGRVRLNLLVLALLACALLAPGAPASAAVPTPGPQAAVATRRVSYPIGVAGQAPGDGFFIRHGYASENTWYNPGYWHTGEDWYAIEGDTAGAQVYAVADGQVVYAGANYPGRVVIVRHAANLYSMYGHLDPALKVRAGQRVARGDLLGVVLKRGDTTPSHLHFELRTFLTTREVNGARPRYPFRCGVRCPPGPGYWPIKAPDHPDAQGWRNPTHLINRRMAASGAPLGQVIVASDPLSDSVTLWSAPPSARQRAAVGQLTLRPGARFDLLAIDAGREDAGMTSALGYYLWYQIGLPGGRAAWVQVAVAATFETGSDRRPSSVYLNLLPSQG
jgi:murein DD-endopeptidase MepM/ murein hydrolase activator NlpD